MCINYVGYVKSKFIFSGCLVVYAQSVGVYVVSVNKIQKLSSFKSNENIHKREDGSYYVVSANKASSVTL